VDGEWITLLYNAKHIPLLLYFCMAEVWVPLPSVSQTSVRRADSRSIPKVKSVQPYANRNKLYSVLFTNTVSLKMFRSFFSKNDRPPDRTEEILARHLDRDFIVFPMAESTASLQDLDAIAERFSVTFPAEFVGHLCGRIPGVYVEVKESLWPRPKLNDVGPFWSFLYGVHSFTPCSTSEDWMRLDHVAQRFQDGTGHKCVPILKVIGDANVYCVDSSGSIVRYDHETNSLSAEPGDFWTVFEREIEQLTGRKVRKVTDA
jgi:hypothetical protein